MHLLINNRHFSPTYSEIGSRTVRRWWSQMFYTKQCVFETQ